MTARDEISTACPTVWKDARVKLGWRCACTTRICPTRQQKSTQIITVVKEECNSDLEQQSLMSTTRKVGTCRMSNQTAPSRNQIHPPHPFPTAWTLPDASCCQPLNSSVTHINVRLFTYHVQQLHANSACIPITAGTQQHPHV